MKYVWFLPLGIFVIFLFLLYFYLNDNPPDKSSSSIKYPYVLSVKPAFLAKDASAEIVYSILHNTMKSTKIQVIGPSGMVFYPNATIVRNSTKLTFPQDIIKGSSSITGNYTVVLTTDKNILNTVNFRVILSPVISSFNNFIFGSSGLAIIIGLIASIITLVYQLSAQQNEDRLLKLENKAKWITANGKYYNDLIENSWNICGKFEKYTVDNQEYFKTSDPTRLLFLIIKFLESYLHIF